MNLFLNLGLSFLSPKIEAPSIYFNLKKKSKKLNRLKKNLDSCPKKKKNRYFKKGVQQILGYYRGEDL